MRKNEVLAYKLARPDGWDFFTGKTINYRENIGKTVSPPSPDHKLGHVIKDVKQLQQFALEYALTEKIADIIKANTNVRTGMGMSMNQALCFQMGIPVTLYATPGKEACGRIPAGQKERDNGTATFVYQNS